MDNIDMSCSICSELFTDPRVLSCGHSFCAECIQKWGQKSRNCPLCKAATALNNPPRNMALASVVDSYREQSSSNVCVKCFTESSACDPCRHCCQLLCPPCAKKHARKLRQRFKVAQQSLEEQLKQMEAGLQPLRKQQMAFTTAVNDVQKALKNVRLARKEAFEKAKSQEDRLNAMFQSRSELIRSVRSTLAELNATAATAAADAATLGRGIEAANRLANRLDSAETGQQCLNGGAGQLPALGEAHELARRLAACLSQTEAVGASASTSHQTRKRIIPCQSVSEAAASTDRQKRQRLQLHKAVAASSEASPPTAASLTRYYDEFPQQPSDIIITHESIDSLCVCWNTHGFMFGHGRIVSEAAAAEDPWYAPLPEEVIIVLELAYREKRKVSVYGKHGGFLGNIYLLRPSGRSVTSELSSLTVNSAQQLLAVYLKPHGQVLISGLDGKGTSVIRDIYGLDCQFSEQALCFSDKGFLYIAEKSGKICLDTSKREYSLLKGGSGVCVSKGVIYAVGKNRNRLFLMSDRKKPQKMPITVDGTDIGGFLVDCAGGLVFSRGGQLILIPQPLVNGASDERRLLDAGNSNYGLVGAYRNGQLCAAVKHGREIHVF